MSTKVIPFKRSFASQPKAIEWSNKNIVSPKNVFKWSKDKYYFDCSKCNHTYKLSISVATKKVNKGCSYCYGSSLCDDNSCDVCFKKSFASHPKSKYWSKKNKLFPRNVHTSSNKKYYFTCDICNHNFDMSLDHFAKRNQSCPYCTNRRLCGKGDCHMCINKSFSLHPVSKEWSIKNPVLPIVVFRCSNDKFLFNCFTCKHTFQSRPNSIAKSKGNCCGYCANLLLCTNDNCILCKNKSFMSHPKAKDWSIENKISPRYVFKGSQKKYKFNCNVCKHTYETSLNNILAGNDCSYCLGNLLCDNEKCNFCLQKSFASHPQSKYWSIKNKILPRYVCKKTRDIYFFDCNKCKHIYDVPLNNVTKDNLQCPYCSNKRLCDDLSCNLCRDKSFVSHPKAQYWSKQNNILPRNIFKASSEKCMFDCPDCKNIYEATLNSISTNNCWCSCTINKTEGKLLTFLKSKYNITIVHGKTFSWCKNKKHLPFDFFIEIYNLIIELDGIQHFKQVRNWQTPEEIQKTDKYKMKLANDNGYSVIRIFQEDVWFDKNDWKTKLIDAIKKYDIVSNIFIGDVYNNTSLK